VSNKIIPVAQTPQQVSVNYGISTGTLANWRTQKKGPKYFKVGSGKILYRTVDVEAFLFSCPVLTSDSMER
jgi:hypothetical protein